MSLVFAAIAPHPPVLIPAIGQDAVKKVQKTQEALERLEEDLYLSKPDCILIISPHGTILQEAFTINYAAQFETDLREFGDLTTRLQFKGDFQMVNKIRESSHTRDYKSIMITEPKLDHGIAVPLYFLARHLPQTNIIPVGFSDLDWKTHVDFGYLIKDQILNTNKRVAVIASGDLSHALTTDAPAGFNAAGAVFDAKIQELLAAHNTAGMLQLDPSDVNDAAECGLRSFLILMGILRDVNYKFQSYAYEGPFGVGYLTANFVL